MQAQCKGKVAASGGVAAGLSPISRQSGRRSTHFRDTQQQNEATVFRRRRHESPAAMAFEYIDNVVIVDVKGKDVERAPQNVSSASPVDGFSRIMYP
jgi:hypothetical protein